MILNTGLRTDIPGFFSKWYLAVAAFRSGSSWLSIAGTVILAVSAVLTAIPFIFALMLPVINPAFDVIFSYMICAVYFSAVIIICWWLLKKVGTKLFNSL